MKRLVLLVCCLLMAWTSVLAVDTYRVECNSVLNVRQRPSSTATVLGTVENGATIEVHRIDNGWAEITYGSRHGYVSAKYIRLVEKSSKAETGIWYKRVSDAIDNLKAKAGNTGWTLYIIIPLILLMAYFRGEWDTGGRFPLWTFCLAVVVLSCMELYYSLGENAFEWGARYDSQGRWFVSWLVHVVVSVLFIYASMAQVCTYYSVHTERFGWLSALPSILLAPVIIVLGLLDVSEVFTFCVVVVMLVVQFGLSLVNVLSDNSHRSMASSIFNALIYSITSVLVSIVLLVLFVEVVRALFNSFFVIIILFITFAHFWGLFEVLTVRPSGSFGGSSNTPPRRPPSPPTISPRRIPTTPTTGSPRPVRPPSPTIAPRRIPRD